MSKQLMLDEYEYQQVQTKVSNTEGQLLVDIS